MGVQKEQFDPFKRCSILQSPSEIVYLPRRNFWLQNHGPAYYQAADWITENGQCDNFRLSDTTFPIYSYGVSSDELTLLRARFIGPILEPIYHGIKSITDKQAKTDDEVDRFFTSRLLHAMHFAGYFDTVVSELFPATSTSAIELALVNRDVLEHDYPANLSIFRWDSPSFISMKYFPKSDLQSPKAVLVVESLRALQLAERQDELPHYKACLGSIAYHELAHIFVESAMYYLMPQYRLYRLSEEKVRFPLIEFIVTGLCPDFESLMLSRDDIVEKQTTLFGWTSVYDGQFIENIKLRPNRDRERVARLAEVLRSSTNFKEKPDELIKRYRVVFPEELLTQNVLDVSDFDLAFMLVCILLSQQTSGDFEKYESIVQRLTFINPDWEEILFG